MNLDRQSKFETEICQKSENGYGLTALALDSAEGLAIALESAEGLASDDGLAAAPPSSGAAPSSELPTPAPASEPSAPALASGNVPESIELSPPIAGAEGDSLGCMLSVPVSAFEGVFPLLLEHPAAANNTAPSVNVNNTV